MDQQLEDNLKNRLLLIWARFCPACNLGRLNPNSSWGRKLIQRRNNCPACKVYREKYAAQEEGEEASK